MLTTEKPWDVVEQEILSIPGNKPVLDDLEGILDDGDALALVGAGCSAELWPLWQDFIQGLINHALEQTRIDQAEAEYYREDMLRIPLGIAQQLRNKVGERLYFTYLHKTFGDKDKNSKLTGKKFTLAHKALIQLPIHSYLTLNYDPGLTNARAALDPDATTSYYFWDQEDAKQILDYKRSILHVHGRYDRNESIILTEDDYHKIYSNRAFVRLLEIIFTSKKLLIVGFGLNDPYINQLFTTICKDYQKGPLKHIALVGLDDKKKDPSVICSLRQCLDRQYGADILFYPIANNHQALTEWLTTLARKHNPMNTDWEIQLPLNRTNNPVVRAITKINLQDEINLINKGLTYQFQPEEYEGPVILRRPIIIDGCGATIWVRRGPVVTIESEGVILRNLNIEYTGDGQIEKPADECAILIKSGINVTLENIKVKGTVIGLGKREWRYPVVLPLGHLTFGYDHSYILHLIVPVQCRIESSNYRFKITPKRLKSGPNEIQIKIDPTFISGYITINTTSLRVIIPINNYIMGQNRKKLRSNKTEIPLILWEPKDWSSFIKRPKLKQIDERTVDKVMLKRRAKGE